MAALLFFGLVSHLPFHPAQISPTALSGGSVTQFAPPPAPPPIVITPPQVSTVAPPLTFQSLPWPWGCIAWHESTWDLMAVNSSSGDSGAFQISAYMWDRFKDSSMPWWIPSASLQQQLTVAERIQANSGWNQWETAPLCGV